MTIINKISPIESRIFCWIRTTGKYEEGGWASCKTNSRIASLLDSISVEYTIKNQSMWFTFLNDASSKPTFWNISGTDFVEEFYTIKNLLGISSKLHVELEEELAFMVMIDDAGFESNKSSGLITKICKGS